MFPERQHLNGFLVALKFCTEFHKTLLKGVCVFCNC